MPRWSHCGEIHFEDANGKPNPREQLYAISDCPHSFDYTILRDDRAQAILKVLAKSEIRKPKSEIRPSAVYRPDEIQANKQTIGCKLSASNSHTYIYSYNKNILTPSIYAQSCEMQHSTQSPIIMHPDILIYMCKTYTYIYMLYVHTESKLWRRLVIQTHRRRLLGIAKKGILCIFIAIYLRRTIRNLFLQFNTRCESERNW